MNSPLMNNSDDSRTEIVDEESGWTSYFEEFFCKHRKESQNSSITCTSDAASCAPNSQLLQKNKHFSSLPNKLHVSKIRGGPERYCDDSLEDTASSPVNSPKVGSLMEMNVNHGETRDNLGARSYGERHLKVAEIKK